MIKVQLKAKEGEGAEWKEQYWMKKREENCALLLCELHLDMVGSQCYHPIQPSATALHLSLTPFASSGCNTTSPHHCTCWGSIAVPSYFSLPLCLTFQCPALMAHNSTCHNCFLLCVQKCHPSHIFISCIHSCHALPSLLTGDTHGLKNGVNTFPVGYRNNSSVG